MWMKEAKVKVLEFAMNTLDLNTVVSCCRMFNNSLDNNLTDKMTKLMQLLNMRLSFYPLLVSSK